MAQLHHPLERPASVVGKVSVPIAAAPPKDTPGPGAAASSMSRPTVAAAPKRQRRHSKSGSAIESMDIDSPTNSTGSNEAVKLMGMGSMSNGGSMTNMSLANGFGMSPRPMMPLGMSMGIPPAMAGMSPPPGMVLGQNGSGTGPQEWEWLTMSL